MSSIAFSRPGECSHSIVVVTVRDELVADVDGPAWCDDQWVYTSENEGLLQLIEHVCSVMEIMRGTAEQGFVVNVTPGKTQCVVTIAAKPEDHRLGEWNMRWRLGEHTGQL